MNESVCPKCGNQINNSEEVCSNCGYILFVESINVDKIDLDTDFQDIKNSDKALVDRFIDVIKYMFKSIKNFLLSRKNIKLTIGLSVILLCFIVFVIYKYRNNEDTYIFKSVCFGMKYNDVLDEDIEKYSKDIDYANKSIVYTHKDDDVSGIKGDISYCFSSSDKQLCRVVFRFRNEDDNVKKMKKYVDKHFGVGKEDDDKGYVRDGKKLKYSYTYGKGGSMEEVVVERK